LTLDHGGKCYGTAYLHYFDEPIDMGLVLGEEVEMLISETPAKSSRETYCYRFLDWN